MGDISLFIDGPCLMDHGTTLSALRGKITFVMNLMKAQNLSPVTFRYVVLIFVFKTHPHSLKLKWRYATELPKFESSSTSASKMNK